jgi:hypothetical protein
MMSKWTDKDKQTLDAMAPLVEAQWDEDTGVLIKKALAEVERSRELVKHWQELCASANTRLQQAIEYIGECQSPIVLNTDNETQDCGECIWCEYYE